MNPIVPFTSKSLFIIILTYVVTQCPVDIVVDRTISPAALVSALAEGLALGYSNPASRSLRAPPLRLSGDQLSVVGAAVPLGALLGAPLSGWAMDRLGRRPAMLLAGLCDTFGWLLIAFGGGFGPVVAGRVVTGIAVGATSVLGPIYVGEVCEPRVRGSVGVMFQALTMVGVLLSYVVGKYLRWNHLALASAAVPFVWVLMAFWLRESPVWLVEKSRQNDALEVLKWLRGPDADVDDELKRMMLQTKEAHEKQASFRDLFKREHRRQFMLSLMLMVLMQLSGINAVIFYSTDVFAAADSSVAPDLATIVVGLVDVLGTLLSLLLVDWLGRKALLIFSDAVMGVCLLALGVYFQLQSSASADGLRWLPLVALILFIVAFSVGFGPIPWVMLGKWGP